MDMIREIANFIENNADKVISLQWSDTWTCERLDLHKALFDDGYTLCIRNNELLIYRDYADKITYKRGSVTELERLYKTVIV